MRGAVNDASFHDEADVEADSKPRGEDMKRVPRAESWAKIVCWDALDRPKACPSNAVALPRSWHFELLSYVSYPVYA